jgi:arsenite/tail-anchored protein-transporting ATPase
VRLLIFTGTGGAGTTTVAAATALTAARRGVKTLLLSPEPAAGPAVSDPLRRAGGESAPAEVEPGLFALRVDARARARRAWHAVDAPLRALLDALGVDPLDEVEFTGLPGLDDVLTLLEIRDAALDGWDLVVVDPPGLARTLRLLALPESARRCVERMLPIERRMLWAMGHGASPTAAPVPARGLVEAAERLSAELAGVHEVLTAPTTSVRLVLTPEAGALEQIRHARRTLALHGLAVDGVVANRVVPSDGNDPWRRARASAQSRVLGDADAAFAPLPVRRLAERAVPPASVANLGRLAGELYGDALPFENEPVVPSGRPAVERSNESDDEFVLVLPLPFVRREEIELCRCADELVVDVAGERRLLTLPSALRRCDVTGARLRGGALRVGFRPDPELWRSP